MPSWHLFFYAGKSSDVMYVPPWAESPEDMRNGVFEGGSTLIMSLDQKHIHHHNIRLLH